jgi:hypothetical protein
VIITLPGISRDINEWNDLAAEFHLRFHAAGI